MDDVDDFSNADSDVGAEAELHHKRGFVIFQVHLESLSRSFLYDALKGCVIALTVLVRDYSPLLYTDRYYSLLVYPYPLSQLSPFGLSFGDCLVVWRFVLGAGSMSS